MSRYVLTHAQSHAMEDLWKRHIQGRGKRLEEAGCEGCPPRMSGAEHDLCQLGFAVTHPGEHGGLYLGLTEQGVQVASQMYPTPGG